MAGITSSVSLAQPAVAFLEDEFNLSRKRAVLIFGAVAFVLCHPAIFFLKNGVVDELDFWGGTFCLVVFATVEVVLFSWVFGMDKAWAEVHHGADMKVPEDLQIHHQIRNAAISADDPGRLVLSGLAQSDLDGERGC